MLTVQQAQDLRAEVKAIRSYLAERQTTQNNTPKQDKAAKIRLGQEIAKTQRQLDEIETQLKGAPAEPWTPDECWARIEESFKDFQTNFEKQSAEFIQRLTDQGFGYTLEWRTPDIVKAEKQAQKTAWVFKLNEIEDVEERVEHFFVRLAEWREELQSDVFRAARSRTSRSTSQASNLVEDARLEATTELLDGMGSSYIWRTMWVKERFESWKKLQAELGNYQAKAIMEMISR